MREEPALAGIASGRGDALAVLLIMEKEQILEEIGVYQSNVGPIAATDEYRAVFTTHLVESIGEVGAKTRRVNHLRGHKK
jgi:hypothetical protein